MSKKNKNHCPYCHDKMVHDYVGYQVSKEWHCEVCDKRRGQIERESQAGLFGSYLILVFKLDVHPPRPDEEIIRSDMKLILEKASKDTRRRIKDTIAVFDAYPFKVTDED